MRNGTAVECVISRIAITLDHNGHNTINGAELLGRRIAQDIGTTYYPSSDRTAGALATKYGTRCFATPPPIPSVSSGLTLQCTLCTVPHNPHVHPLNSTEE